MSGGDRTHNENKGSVGGPLIQGGTFYGDVTVPQDAPADESLAQDLAGVVGVRSREEEEHWRIGDPVPLRVRWHEAEASLFDDWGNIHRDDQRHDPVPLSGQFTAIREIFQATGSRRLVILGRAGAGKTVLAHRLILDLLASRDHRGPVPVLFSLGDWNPTATRLREWMIDRLVRDFAFLANRDVDATRERGAEVLVNRNWILPVLDGFDELPDRHHRAAVRQINQVQLPLLLTSRPDQYARAAVAANVVGRAAAVEIEDLTLDQAQRYLCRSAGPSRAAEWESVFERLHAEPERAASRNLVSALTTPLMIMFARTHYEEASHDAPGELLDTVRFPAGTDLQRHLLSGYVTTVYDFRRNVHPSGRARPAWNHEQARHWLGYLATRLQAHDTHDFMWWQLPALLTRRTRHLATLTMFGLAGGLAFGLAGGLAFGPVFGPAFGVPFGLPGGPPVGLAIGLAVGVTFGLAVGLFSEVNRTHGRGREPERLRLYGRGRGRQRRRFTRASLNRAASEFTNGLVVGLAFGLAIGVAVGLANGLEFGLANGLTFGLANGLAGGLAFGVVIGVVNVLVSVLGEGLDPHDSDPWQLLATDRTGTLIRTIPVGLLGTMPASVLGTGLIAGFGCGLLITLPRLALSAWGNWLLFARLWLPLTGCLPWRPKRFLEDAHDRGILRRAGAAYQFRHAELRDHLAQQHPHTHPPS